MENLTLKQKSLYWYNYKTGEYEYIETPTDFTDYIPQAPAAQGMYRFLLAMGKAPIDAACDTLSACVGLSPSPTGENAPTLPKTG